jgi:hypothetical protein
MRHILLILLLAGCATVGSQSRTPSDRYSYADVGAALILDGLLPPQTEDGGYIWNELEYGLLTRAELRAFKFSKPMGDCENYAFSALVQIWKQFGSEIAVGVITCQKWSGKEYVAHAANIIIFKDNITTYYVDFTDNTILPVKEVEKSRSIKDVKIITI